MEELIKKAAPIFELLGDNEIYLVGGTIRDVLLGRQPRDLDFATSLDLIFVEDRLRSAGFTTWNIDKGPRVIGTKLINEDTGEVTVVEIANYRGQTIEEDLEHRDFTINAMATRDGKIIDPFGGLKDISKQLIKCTKSSSDRFSEDPFRMLRAIRFVSTLGFRLEERTKDNIEAYAHSILITSKERWFNELTKLLLGDNVKPALELLFKTRLLGYLLPEVYPITMTPRTQTSLTKDLWYHTKIVVSKSQLTLMVRWAALLHDIAKPQTMIELTEGTHFFQHEYLGAELADATLIRIRAGFEIRQSVRGLVSLHQRIGDTVSRGNDPPVSINALRRLARDCDVRKCNIEDLVELFAADCSSGRKDVVERQQVHADLLRQALKKMREEDLRPRLPKGIGEALMAHFNLKPGPEVGELKKRLDDMLLSGTIISQTPFDKMFKLLEEL